MLCTCVCCGSKLTVRQRLRCLRERQSRCLSYYNVQGDLCTVTGRWFCEDCLFRYSGEPLPPVGSAPAQPLPPAEYELCPPEARTCEVQYTPDGGRTWETLGDANTGGAAALERA